MPRAQIIWVLLAACHGMYSQPPEALRNPPKRMHRMPPGGFPQEPTPVYVENCDVDFTGQVATARKTYAATEHLAAGNASLENAGPTSSAPAATRAAVDAIERYREALVADPYNADATLRLALAYDRVLRKGCALAMLKRLAALADNAQLAAEAKPDLELVRQNRHWFRGYRSVALEVIGD